jgi:hypothetical protein
MISAKLDEVIFPGQAYSRRPRIRAAGLEVIAGKRNDAIVCAMCRALIADGHDRTQWIEVCRGRTLVLRLTIGEGADLTVRETEQGPKFTRYVPFKWGADAPHLDQD